MAPSACHHYYREFRCNRSFSPLAPLFDFESIPVEPIAAVNQLIEVLPFSALSLHTFTDVHFLLFYDPFSSQFHIPLFITKKCVRLWLLDHRRFSWTRVSCVNNKTAQCVVIRTKWPSQFTGTRIHSYFVSFRRQPIGATNTAD